MAGEHGIAAAHCDHAVVRHRAGDSSAYACDQALQQPVRHPAQHQPDRAEQQRAMQRARGHAMAHAHFVPERITARGDRRDDQDTNHWLEHAEKVQHANMKRRSRKPFT
jgi:hypothetical protein